MGAFSAMTTSTFGGAVGSETFAYYVLIGGWMVSASSLGNLGGKIVLGFLVDKAGLKPALLTFLALTIAGFICLAFSGGSVVLLIIGAVGVGTSSAIMSVGTPLITRTVFGLKYYSKIYSYIYMGIAVLGGLGSVTITTLANVLNGYSTAYLVYVGVFAFYAICMFGALANAKSFRAKWDEE